MLSASLLAAAVAAAAPADTDNTPAVQAQTLEAVEVQGQRPLTVESVDQARERLAQRAGGTGVVDAKSFRRGRVSTLADALGMATGVFVQPRFGAEEARLSIRGSGLQRTFHGRGIELLQDGSPLNLADGGFDFQAVEPLAAQYVEVFRGANALEFGAATLGGAINFVSFTGHDAPRVTARLEGGEFGYLRAQAALAGTSGQADGYASLSRMEQDGFRDHAEQKTDRLFANAGYRFSDQLDGRVYLTHVDTASQLPGSLTFAEFQRDPSQAAPGNIALDQRRDFDLTRLAGTLAWAPDASSSLVLSTYYSDKKLDHPIFQVLLQDTEDYGADLRWRHEGELAGRRNALVLGGSIAQGDVEDDRFVNVAGSPGARTNAFEQRARNARLYVENQTWLQEKWVLAVGAQALSAERRSRDRFITGGRDESFDVDYSGVSPKLGMRYLASEATQWFGNVSASREPPSFGELTGGPGVTQVDQQEATTGELGVRHQSETFTVDAALYRAHVDDELLALTDGAGNPLGTVNADRTIHQGLELGLGWRFAPGWSVSANYLYNDFHFDGDAVFGDNELAGVPPQQLRTELRWELDRRFFVAPHLEWAPQDYYVDHANSFRAPGYTVVGVRVGGELAEGLTWFMDARNLQDRAWIASTNVVADARGLDGRNFLPGDGRSFYVGLEWRLP